MEDTLSGILQEVMYLQPLNIQPSMLLSVSGNCTVRMYSMPENALPLNAVTGLPLMVSGTTTSGAVDMYLPISMWLSNSYHLKGISAVGPYPPVVGIEGREGFAGGVTSSMTLPFLSTS